MKTSCFSSKCLTFPIRKPRSEAKAIEVSCVLTFPRLTFLRFTFYLSVLQPLVVDWLVPSLLTPSVFLALLALLVSGGPTFPSLSREGGSGRCLLSRVVPSVCIWAEAQLLCWPHITLMPGPNRAHYFGCQENIPSHVPFHWASPVTFSPEE